jgi:hypothetical protein
VDGNEDSSPQLCEDLLGVSAVQTGQIKVTWLIATMEVPTHAWQIVSLDLLKDFPALVMLIVFWWSWTSLNMAISSIATSIYCSRRGKTVSQQYIQASWNASCYSVR